MVHSYQILPRIWRRNMWYFTKLPYSLAKILDRLVGKVYHVYAA